jgi:hypothetical protein
MLIKRLDGSKALCYEGAEKDFIDLKNVWDGHFKDIENDEDYDKDIIQMIVGIEENSQWTARNIEKGLSPRKIAANLLALAMGALIDQQQIGDFFEFIIPFAESDYELLEEAYAEFLSFSRTSDYRKETVADATAVLQAITSDIEGKHGLYESNFMSLFSDEKEKKESSNVIYPDFAGRR